MKDTDDDIPVWPDYAISSWSRPLRTRFETTLWTRMQNGKVLWCVAVVHAEPFWTAPGKKRALAAIDTAHVRLEHIVLVASEAMNGMG